MSLPQISFAFFPLWTCKIQRERGRAKRTGKMGFPTSHAQSLDCSSAEALLHWCHRERAAFAGRRLVRGDSGCKAACRGTPAADAAWWSTRIRRGSSLKASRVGGLTDRALRSVADWPAHRGASRWLLHERTWRCTRGIPADPVSALQSSLVAW